MDVGSEHKGLLVSKQSLDVVPLDGSWAALLRVLGV